MEQAMHQQAFERPTARRLRIAREPMFHGFAVPHALTLARAPRSARHDRPSRFHRLPPTRAARSSRSRGVFLAPGRRTLTAVLLGAGLFVLAALLGTADVVGSNAFDANPGPRLVASASIVPPQVAALRF